MTGRLSHQVNAGRPSKTKALHVAVKGISAHPGGKGGRANIQGICEQGGHVYRAVGAAIPVEERVTAYLDYTGIIIGRLWHNRS